MKEKFFSILLLIIIFLNPIFGENFCTKPDQYLLKCQFDETIYDKSFTCIDTNCQNKLYTIDKNILLADFPSENKSVQIFKNQINLNKIQNHLEIVQILCTEKINPTIIQVLEKKIQESNNPNKQTFTGDKLIIQQENRKFNKKHICYETYYETYLGWHIEQKIKKPYCEPEHNSEKDCTIQKIKSFDYIQYSYENPNQIGTYIILTTLLAISFITGIIGIFTHIIENKQIQTFITIDNKKILIMATLMIPIFYALGKIIDLIFKEIYLTSNLIPVIIILSGILLTYFISSIIHLILINKLKIKKKKKHKKTKEIFKKRKRI